MENFGNSTSIRFPICFCIDLTESMMGDGVKDAQTVFLSFKAAIENAVKSGLCIETAVVSFSGKSIIVKNFSEEALDDKRIGFDMVGGSADGLKAMNDCLKLIQARKEQYAQMGIQYRRPWVVIISDGRFSFNGGNETEAAKIYLTNLLTAQKNKKCWVIPVQAGGCDIKKLSSLCLTRQSISLDKLDFNRMASTLSMSISQSAARLIVEHNPIDDLTKLISEAIDWSEIRKKKGEA